MLSTLLLAAGTAAFLVEGRGPEFKTGVPYITRVGADGKAFELKMNIAVPGEGKGRPCVVAIHGGGWTAGRREDLDFLARLVAEQGWVGATVSYRFAPTAEEHGPERACFPAQYEDCAEAVRFLKAHAEEYGVDPKRIGVVGFSAGAHLAMMLATAADAPAGAEKADGLPGTAEEREGARVRAAVSFVGPTDLNAADIPAVSEGIVQNLVGREAEAGGVSMKERRRIASPLAHVTKGDAPMLMFFGTKDPLVPHTQAFPMLAAMTAAGVAGRAEILVGHGHAFSSVENTRALAAMKAFFEEWMK